MKITVKNFGPIKNATNISVSPMTVFVGPSNTGKSYLAMLIYSIIKTLGRNVVTPLFWYNRISSTLRANETLGTIIREIAETVSEDRTKLPKEISRRSIRIVDGCLSLWADIAAEIVKEEIIYCFGEEGKKIFENGDGVVINITDPGNLLTLNLCIPGNSRLNYSEKKRIANLIDKRICDAIDRMQHEEEFETVSDFMYGVFERIYLLEIDLRFTSLLRGGENSFEKIYYLPAIRGGIMQIHRTVISVLIQRVSMTGLSDRLLFTGVLSDFMTQLVNTESAGGKSRDYRGLGDHGTTVLKNSIPQATGEIEQIGNKIEDQIMGGTIEVQSSETRYPDFRYVFQKDEQDHDLPLMSVSSMVSELAPVSLFIRHHIRNGDLLVLEEPEAHLHPGAQREIANALVQLVNAGVHVLITTHSSTILEQIGNCIQATKVPRTWDVTRLDKEKKTLEENKSSVYVFPKTRRSQPGSTVVKKVPFDPEGGILIQDHMDVFSALYNETVSLLNSRGDQDD